VASEGRADSVSATHNFIERNQAAGLDFYQRPALEEAGMSTAESVLVCALCLAPLTDREVDVLDDARAFVIMGETVMRQEGRRPTVAVLVYDYEGIPAHTMRRAREKVNRIYRETGVEIDWFGPLTDARNYANPASSSSYAFTVQMIIRSSSRSGAPSSLKSVMGTAFGADENGGTFSLFYDQVTRVARNYIQPIGDILGLAIAHELGHLLLPGSSHSSTGIMRAEWNGDDIRHGVAGSLAFTSAQAALIRSKVDGRCLHEAK
jgi:hypothetical protein